MIKCIKCDIPHKIGCGLANGNWHEVMRIIMRVFQNYNGNVYICRNGGYENV